MVDLARLRGPALRIFSVLALVAGSAGGCSCGTPDGTPSKDGCEPDPCNGHGACSEGVCACDENFTGERCDACSDSDAVYPDCDWIEHPCGTSHPCPCPDGLIGIPPECVECKSDVHCTSEAAPFCDLAANTCVACLSDADPPPPDTCAAGVCALVPPACVDHQWVCSGPGYEPVEETCDGFDNDCDGQTDEGVCPPCEVPIAEIQNNLHAKWDIDFDYACRTYLTTLISGGDYSTQIDPTAGPSVTEYYGNANQDMGYALVDPDPSAHRVVVVYSCLFSCFAVNGLTLLYTCDGADPTCGCAGQATCPGFLETPFLKTGSFPTSVSYNGFQIGTPTGLAAGAGHTYYVGNFKPEACDDSPGCVACTPDNPGVFCAPSKPNCCDTTPLGRLARFTLPAPNVEPTWRVEKILEGEQIIGLASGRDGSVAIGTYVAPGQGNFYRYDPTTGALKLLQSFPGTVFTIAQNRRNGDYYLEVQGGSPHLVRVSEAGTVLPLPPGLPADPAGDAALQFGPDGKLYRLRGAVDAAATLEVFELP